MSEDMTPQVVEVSASSSHSFEEAIRRAVQRGAMRMATISKSRITSQERVSSGDGVEFRVQLELS